MNILANVIRKKKAMNIDLPTMAKIMCFMIYFSVGVLSANDALHSNKSFGERFFEALMMMLVWALIGILTIYFAKFFLFLIGAFLVISLVIWFKDRMSK